MKKTLYSLIATLLLLWAPAFTMQAQDARQRDAATIISDGMAQLPAQNQQVFNTVMEEIAKTGAAGIESMADMLVPADKGHNNITEYAINGVVAYVTAPGREAMRAEVRKGLKAGIQKCTDNPNKAFLLTQLMWCGTQEDAPFFEGYLRDAYLGEYASRGLIWLGGAAAQEEVPAITAADVKAAKKAIKAGKAFERAKALLVICRAEGIAATPYIVKAMDDADIEYRAAALMYASDFATDATYAQLVAKASKSSNAVKMDVVNWLAYDKVTAQEPWIAAQVASKDAALSKAAIEAAGKLGGEKNLAALVEALSGPNAKEAAYAISHFKGNPNEALLAALDEPAKQLAVLPLVGQLRIAAAKAKVMALLGSSDAAISKAAYTALAGVCRVDDFNTLADMAEKAQGDQKAALAEAMRAAATSETPQKQNELAVARIATSKDASIYYPILAQAGDRRSIAALVAEYNKGNKDAAFASLLTVKNEAVVAELFKIAADADRKDAALTRALALAGNSSFTEIRKYRMVEEALELNPSLAVRNRYIASLQAAPIPSAFTLAAKYLDVKESSLDAAKAVKTIVTKCATPLGGEDVKAVLLKAQEVFRAQSDADSGYAVDEITQIIGKLPQATASTIFELSPEEAAEGFEVLFDGTNLDKWQGNTTNYTPIDGAIYVDASYGSGGNLYTKKEYSDFVYRFEFMFLVEGVNNGVGIRGPMDVDAAYEGMEIQILDHDAPIYRNLHEYQQHGSVYGIIPSKRVKFGELNTWHCMEVRAEGDNIKVTVDGEVITDGNIREACQGHNVAPEGETKNPYTVDHKNHPGLFNKSGFISFCGHGTGVKFRNIRVLDLSKNAKAKGKKKSKK